MECRSRERDTATPTRSYCTLDAEIGTVYMGQAVGDQSHPRMNATVCYACVVSCYCSALLCTGDSLSLMKAGTAAAAATAHTIITFRARKKLLAPCLDGKK